jgi:glycosyltransferase involved in cell wall biosynthesis
VWKLRVALLCETFSKKMGYLQYLLPKHLALLGVDMHVITMNLPPYHQMKDFYETYAGFNDRSDLKPGTIEKLDGFTLHVLPHKRVGGYMRMAGLFRKLRALQPDVVQTTTNINWVGIDAAVGRLFLGYRLFTGCHYHASVFPLAQCESEIWNLDRIRCFLTRGLPGRFVSLLTEKCHAITPDCADVAVRFFGVPRKKVDVCPLGVDAQLFFPISSDPQRLEAADLRQELGFEQDDIVCVYSGRFSEEKNPLLLAKSIHFLTGQGERYRGLFIGNGAQAADIRSCAGCVVHDFVPVFELGNYFRAGDIGVWPTQESMSMLDAAACGIPIVANDTMSATERLDGNGLAYRLNDQEDLVRALLALKTRESRKKLGVEGARKMLQEFSWEAIARRRLRDYEVSIGQIQTDRQLQRVTL